MLSEGTYLYLAICFTWLIFSTVWADRRAVVWVPRHLFIKKFTSLYPSQTPGNETKALNAFLPFSFLGRSFRAAPLPIAISPNGICDESAVFIGSATVRPKQSGRMILFDDIKIIELNGCQLWINKQKFTICQCPQTAILLKDFINKMCHTPMTQRAEEIQKFLEMQFEEKRYQKNWKKMESQIRILNFIAYPFIGLIFIVLPLLSIVIDEAVVIAIAFILDFIFSLTLAILFFIYHRRWAPKSLEERLSLAIFMLAFPPLAMRAADFLSRAFADSADPLVINAILTPESQLSLDYLRTLQNPLISSAYSTQGKACLDYFRQAVLLQLQKKYSHLDIQHLPAPLLDSKTVAYCPRCSAQFIVQRRYCSDCPNIELRISCSTSSEEESVKKR